MEELTSSPLSQTISNQCDEGNDEVISNNITPVECALKVKGAKRKKGIVYITNIPKHMNVTRMREYLSPYGDINRIYLQPTTQSNEKKRTKNKPFVPRHFSEGWVEFRSKRVARQVAEMLNNKQIAQRKRSQFYDFLWSIRYLPHFKWHHLTERMRYEQTVLKQRGRMEVSQAQREANFFQTNLDKSEWQRRHPNTTHN